MPRTMPKQPTKLRTDGQSRAGSRLAGACRARYHRRSHFLLYEECFEPERRYRNTTNAIERVPNAGSSPAGYQRSRLRTSAHGGDDRHDTMTTAMQVGETTRNRAGTAVFLHDDTMAANLDDNSPRPPNRNRRSMCRRFQSSD